MRLAELQEWEQLLLAPRCGSTEESGTEARPPHVGRDTDLSHAATWTCECLDLCLPAPRVAFPAPGGPARPGLETLACSNCRRAVLVSGC